MDNQGNKVGMDNSKFGLKFDSEKSRIDLVDIASFNKILLKVSNIPDNEGVDYYNQEISIAYLSLLSNIEYIDGGRIKYSEEALSAVTEIYYCAVKFLDCRYIVNVIKQVGDLYAYGAKLYGDNNWKMVNASRYVSALGRHIDLVVTDNRYDSESGMHHAVHIIWNCIAIVNKMCS